MHKRRISALTKKHPADMTLTTLKNYYYDCLGLRNVNWVFPMDMTGFIGPNGGLTRREREMRAIGVTIDAAKHEWIKRKLEEGKE